MRILSLWQPWASLWVAGAHGPVPAKAIETRSWGTKYRGPIAVHASKKWGTENFDAMAHKPFPGVLVSLGVKSPLDLPLGCIIGVVDLVDCLRMTAFKNQPPEKFIYIGDNYAMATVEADVRITPVESAFGNYSHGRYAWITGPTRKKLDTPIPYRGAQGLRELDPAVAARLA